MYLLIRQNINRIFGLPFRLIEGYSPLLLPKDDLVSYLHIYMRLRSVGECVNASYIYISILHQHVLVRKVVLREGESGQAMYFVNRYILKCKLKG